MNSLIETIHGVYGGILLLLLWGPLTVLWAVAVVMAAGFKWCAERLEEFMEWLERELL